MTTTPDAPAAPERRTTPLPRHDHLIGGERVPPADGAYFGSDNPTTGQPWYEAARGTAADVGRAVEAARTTFESPGWRRMSRTRRGALLRRVGELVGEHAEELARTESTDNGKLLREMRAQLAGLPECFFYYAGLADKIQGETIPASSVDVLNYTLREPVGVVGAITPWNSPLTLTVAKLAPLLACGNTAVVKPSEYTSASMLALAPLFEEAGFPAGAVNVVTGFGGEAGAPLVDHDDVAKLSFTGSTATGSWIAERAGRRLVRAGLELGGKSPQLVFADADVASAANGVIAGIFAAAGQTCIAGSRVLAHRSVYDELVQRVVERARTIRIGDPLDEGTELGPLAMAAQLAKVEEYVTAGRAEGGVVAHGGGRPDTGLGGWVPRAHRVHRPRQRHPHVPRGDLRPGRRDHPVRRRRGGTADRERHRLGPRRRHLDARPRPRPPGRGRPGRRHGLGEHVPRDVPPVAAVWVQGLRSRCRARHRGRPRVHATEERVDQHQRRARGRPVRPAVLGGTHRCPS
ncbi:Aldehyde dehydrogenase [Pseudonocardia sp. Ae168_Ps1]|nr:Aldehyde dehydrogenase [Pseudonocardia sp. Ae150A_Ps1]OLL78325.1 Aldehyde dehydrogenase [Pseudonocardia sp. Ae168_Ps1]OLL87549.1 Aldehyde dehydrogenase [Pseudonocardia sp. Ae263_Ps1]OLL92421.1 Aldehyde dehydrogenase [Pseudonocardia sp. Ae356_Ps1]